MKMFTSKWDIVIFVFKLRTRGVGKDLKGSGDDLVQFLHFIQKYKTSDSQGPNDSYSVKSAQSYHTAQTQAGFSHRHGSAETSRGEWNALSQH